VVNASDRRARSILARDLGDRLTKALKQSIKTERGTYTVYCENPWDVELARSMVTKAPTAIYKLSAYPENNVVEVAAEAREDATLGTFALLKEFSRYVTKPHKG